MTRPGDLPLALGPVAARLREMRIPFRVTGSVASAVRGVPRATMDVDLVAQLPASRVRALLESLRGGYYGDVAAAEAAARRGSSFNLIHEETMVKIDIFVRSPGPLEAEEMARSTEEDLGEPGAPLLVPVTSAEDLVVAKLRWFRDGGGRSEQQWKDILGVLRVRGDDLEKAHLDRRAREEDIAALLAKALDEARA